MMQQRYAPQQAPYQQQYQQQQQQAAQQPRITSVPLSNSAEPVPPLTRIGEHVHQALFTTYPSRVRLGLTGLCQPIPQAANSAAGKIDGPVGTPGPGASGPGTPAASSSAQPSQTTTSGRRRTVVSYAEMEGLGSDEEDDEMRRSRGGTPAQIPDPPIRRGPGRPPKDPYAHLRQQSPATPHQVAPQPQRPIWGADNIRPDPNKSYRGQRPPGNLVHVQLAKVTKHQAFSDDQLAQAADDRLLMVPVMIELEVDNLKIRDTLVWNANEKLITPEVFARIFCEDLDLPYTPYANEVAKQVRDQVDELHGLAELMVRSEEDERDDVEKDLRVVINLDLQIGALHLTDRIEWDLSSNLTPELFAAVLVRDLSLPPEAAPLIAHQIHEELVRHKRTCLEIGLIAGDDEDEPSRRTAASRGAKVLEGVWREWSDIGAFGPRVDRLSAEEMERRELDRERASRRAKRDRAQGAQRTTGRPGRR